MKFTLRFRSHPLTGRVEPPPAETQTLRDSLQAFRCPCDRQKVSVCVCVCVCMYVYMYIWRTSARTLAFMYVYVLNLQEVLWWSMDWINLAQARVRLRTPVNAVMNLWFPWNARNFSTSWEPVSFSRRTLLLGVRVYLSIYVYAYITLHNYVTIKFQGVCGSYLRCLCGGNDNSKSWSP
jgi:hypothetical protein